MVVQWPPFHTVCVLIEACKGTRLQQDVESLENGNYSGIERDVRSCMVDEILGETKEVIANVFCVGDRKRTDIVHQARSQRSLLQKKVSGYDVLWFHDPPCCLFCCLN